MNVSEIAELSTLQAQIEEVTRRVLHVAEHYDDSADSAVASELFTAERGLIAARRSLERAVTLLTT